MASIEEELTGPGEDLVGLASIRAAAATLSGVAVRTPLVELTGCDLPAGIALKLENLQRSGAFKFRGAYTMLSRTPQEIRARGVITYSSGNHGAAVALAARILGTRSVVVMPTDAVKRKVERIRGYGGEVKFVGNRSGERRDEAYRIAAESGLVVVPPFDHPDIIAGQGTTGLEILEDRPDASTIVVPVGAGGQISGIAAWVKRTKPDCRIIGVEPRGAAVVRHSLEAGHPAVLDGVSSIGDGLRSDHTGPLVFEHVSRLVDDLVLVEDSEIVAVSRLLLHQCNCVVEFSGAAALAALASGRVSGGGGVVVVVSGGNVDPAHPLLR